MITRDNLSKMLFFDIETAGAEETFKDTSWIKQVK